MKAHFQSWRFTAMSILLFLMLHVNAFSQSVATTAYPALYTGTTAVIVDENLVITSSGSITDMRVTITGNFSSGDSLSYTGTLPPGVSSSYDASFGELVFTGTVTAAEWQSFLRTVTFKTSSSDTSDRNITFSVGNLIAGNNGHFYEFVPFANAASSLSWKIAKDSASGRSYYGWQGYLATITSQDENDIIFQRLSASGWIGSADDYEQVNLATGTTTYADQTSAEGNWYWVTGPEAGQQFSYSPWAGATPTAINGMYINWSSNEPNNNWNTVRDGVLGEQYGEIYSGNSSWGQPGKWNDFYNVNADMDFVQGYVVEYGGMPGDTSLILASSRAVVFSGAILASTGLQFNAIAVEKNVRLQWSTQSEINTSRFVIQHSTDGIHFTDKAVVAASGNSISAKNYTWTDAGAENGIHYYRLKMMDTDESYSYSNVVAVQLTISGRVSASVYPNPARPGSDVNLHITADQAQQVSIAVYSLSGQKQQETKLEITAGSRLYHLQTNNLPAGTYMLSITGEHGGLTGQVQKILLQ